ncbi:Toll-Interleukin receptor domain protein [Candidatus Magnetomoraceae bacterium gMMP-1]
MNYIKPKRSFENSGLVDPAMSYHVQLDHVVNTTNQDIKTMVDIGRYFSIFAPRQSGKTTFFHDFCVRIENDPMYISILLSFQLCKNLDRQTFYELIQEDLYNQLINRLEKINCPQLEAVTSCLNSINLTNSASFFKLFMKLNTVIKFKKIVIFIDEFDGIPLDELENFLTTLRELYQKYKMKNDKALYSIGLVGIRNITKLIVGGVSPFNIADQVTLPSFSLNNIRDLYAQYTEETNQPFTEDAVKKVQKETEGQPWLVNRLGSILTVNIKPETTEPITAENVDKAVNILLSERNSHFDNLSQKIESHKEIFIRILDNNTEYNPEDKEQTWLEQYGLIRQENNLAYIANPIYKRRFSKFLPKKVDLPIADSNQKKKIFISYSREDKEWLDKLLMHLSTLKYEGIQYWYDKEIRTGDDWSPEIQNAIETSQVAICLISKNFLGSEFIRTREIPEILNMRKQGMTIIPVLVGSCAWKRVNWLKEIQINPKDGVPLSKMSQEDQEEILIDIVDEIGQIFDNIK